MTWKRSLGGAAGLAALVAALSGCGGMERQRDPEYDAGPDAEVEMDADYENDGDVVLPDSDVLPDGDALPDGDMPDADEDADVDTPEPPLLDHCYEACSTTDIVPFERAGDTLGLNELLGDVVETMDSSDADALGSYTVSNDLGSTDVNQYLRFNWGTGDLTDRTRARVLHTKDDDDRVGEFLIFRDSEEAFRYETEFVEGLRSRIDDDGNLTDLLYQTWNIMGEEFIVSGATIDEATARVDLDLLGSAVGTNVQEGTERTVECNGNTYDIRNWIVSEIDGELRTRLEINGEMVTLEAGSYSTLSDGATVFVRDLVEVVAEDGVTDQFAELYLSDNHVHFSDTDIRRGSTDGTVEINEENIEDSEVNIWTVVESRPDGDRYRIDKIAYTLFTDGARGDEPHLAPGEGFRSEIDEAIGMLSRYWDITFSGVTTPLTSEIELKASGDDEYRIDFVNTQGINYDNLRLAFASIDGLFYGDDDNSLVFMQGSDASDESNYTIRSGDYVVLSHDGDTATGVTRVLRYDTFFVEGAASFTDVGTGGTVTGIVAPAALPLCSTGHSEGSLPVGGYVFDFAICMSPSAGTPVLLFDNDDDGTLGGEANIVDEHGAIIDLGTQATDAYRAAVPGDSIDVAVTIEGSRFDEPHADETMYVLVNGDRTTGTIDAEVVRDYEIGLSMVRHEAPDENILTGMTSFGIFAQTYDETGDPDTIELYVPEEQVLSTANVEFCYEE